MPVINPEAFFGEKYELEEITSLYFLKKKSQ